MRILSLLIFAVLFATDFSDCQAQESSQQLLTYANDEIRQSNYGKALIYIDSARIINPHSAESFFLEAYIYEQEGKKREAIDSYNEGLKINPEFIDAYVNNARLHHELKDHRDYSISNIDAAIRIDNANSELYSLKAFYLVSTINSVTGEPDLKEAIQNMDKAIALDKKNDQFYIQRGRYKFMDGERLGSLQDLSTAIELAPENHGHYHDRGITYLSIESFKKAEADFSSAIQLDPGNQDYYRKRGHSKYNQLNYDGAIDDFTTAIDLIYHDIMGSKKRIEMDDPLNISLRDMYVFRGAALIFTENTYEACQDFKNAQQLGAGKAENYIRRYCAF